MGLKKGTTNNPNGRPKGKPNKATSDMRTFLSELLGKNKLQIERDLKKLEPKDRLMILERFMQYTTPKMQSMEAKIDLNRLSEEQLEDVIYELTKEIDNE